jgi:hypothetical protein
LEIIKDLEKLLTERIADLYEVKGMMQARHAYLFYRQKLWEIRSELIKHMAAIEEQPQSPDIKAVLSGFEEWIIKNGWTFEKMHEEPSGEIIYGWVNDTWAFHIGTAELYDIYLYSL